MARRVASVWAFGVLLLASAAYAEVPLIRFTCSLLLTTQVDGVDSSSNGSSSNGDVSSNPDVAHSSPPDPAGS